MFSKLLSKFCPNGKRLNILIQINIDSEDIITGLSLVNNIGEEVLNNYLGSYKNISKEKLDISNLPRGMYFIRLKVNNQIINHKILLQ